MFWSKMYLLQQNPEKFTLKDGNDKVEFKFNDNEVQK